MKTLRRTFFLPILLLFFGASASAQKPDTSAGPWEEEIRKFEQADSVQPPPTGAILFVGSSSIRMWETLPQDFPDQQVINRGFGGSELNDVIHFADRIIFPYRPRMVIVYAGDNDLANGKKPEQVFSDYRRLVYLIQKQLPETRICFISIKPSLARWKLAAKVRSANTLIKNYSRRAHRVAYIDLFTPMLGKDGTPRKELFAPDGLHLNREGYGLWKSVVQPYLVQG